MVMGCFSQAGSERLVRADGKLDDPKSRTILVKNTVGSAEYL